MRKLLLTFAVLTAAALSLSAEPITVLTSGNRLLTVDSATPGTVMKTVTVTGLATGESLVGIDFRPAVGGLFGLGSTSRIYSIDANTGVATAVGAASVFTLTGTRFGFDFNPVPDRIRVTSDSDQNLRLNPNDGTISGTDGTLAYAATDPNSAANPNIVGSAYTNSFAGAAATVLYDIDSNLDILTVQEPPNAGTLLTVGALGVDTSDLVGFDISGTSGVAYASLTVSGVTSLYTVNLRTGAISNIPAGATTAAPIAPTDLGTETVIDIAASVNPGARFRNVATRGRVGAGEDILIAGFISRGGGPAGVATRYVLRGIGPSLAGKGVGTPLADPVLTLFDSNGVAITSNDDFSASADAAAITAAGLAPTDGRESAILRTLPPGSYTAQITRKGDTAGVALLEVYELP